jgi:hypothetical protein
VVNDLTPLNINQIREELEYAKFISDMTGSSTHKHTKLVRISVRYFVPQHGVKIKIIEFTNLSEESSVQLNEHITRVREEAKLIDKAVSLSADDTHISVGINEQERTISSKGSEIKLNGISPV